MPGIFRMGIPLHSANKLQGTAHCAAGKCTKRNCKVIFILYILISWHQWNNQYVTAMWPSKSAPVFGAMPLWISYYFLVFQVLCFTKKLLSTSHMEGSICMHWGRVSSIVFGTEHCPLSLLQEKWLTSAVDLKSLVDCSFSFFLSLVSSF